MFNYQMMKVKLPTPVKSVERNLKLKENIFANPIKLDPRDVRIRIPFKSDFVFTDECFEKDLKFKKDENEEKEEKSLNFIAKTAVTDWVAEVIETITSASFNLLNEKSLSEEEVKNYTAKNILLNIKEFI
jgi:hypothetical protein